MYIMVELRSNSEGHKLDDWKDCQTCYGLIFSTWGGAFVVPDKWRKIFHMVRVSQPATAVVKEFLGLQRFQPSEPVWFRIEVQQDILTFTLLFHQNQMKLPRFWTQHLDLCRSFRSLIVRRKCVLYRAKPASSVARPSCIFFIIKLIESGGRVVFKRLFP